MTKKNQFLPLIPQFSTEMRSWTNFQKKKVVTKLNQKNEKKSCHKILKKNKKYN